MTQEQLNNEADLIGKKFDGSAFSILQMIDKIGKGLDKAFPNESASTKRTALFYATEAWAKRNIG